MEACLSVLVLLLVSTTRATADSCPGGTVEEASANLVLLQTGMTMQAAKMPPKAEPRQPDFGGGPQELIQAAGGREKEKGQHVTTTSTEAGLFDADILANPQQRVWFMCKAPADQPTPKAAKKAGIARMTAMNCTRQLTFKSLCCLPWSTGLQFKFPWNVQVPPARDDSTESGIDKPVRLFTEESAGTVFMKETNTTDANLQIMEVAAFTESEIQGNSNFSPGEAVLRSRIKFLQAQGLPKDSIPTCAKEVAECPNGAPPATVSADGLASSLLETRGWGGSLMTSGSFTMMASSGGD